MSKDINNNFDGYDPEVDKLLERLNMDPNSFADEAVERGAGFRDFQRKQLIAEFYANVEEAMKRQFETDDFPTH